MIEFTAHMTRWQGHYMIAYKLSDTAAGKVYEQRTPPALTAYAAFDRFAVEVSALPCTLAKWDGSLSGLRREI